MMNQSNLGEMCVICKNYSYPDAQGIFIRDNFICVHCEHMILSLKVDDIYYPFVKNCLKNIWFNLEDKDPTFVKR